MHVVKLGGSLLRTPQDLRDWLRLITSAGSGRVVVVPGGGPFADAVRSAQIEIGFDDRAAHRMALLAMEQCGLLLASFEGSLVPADSFVTVREVLHGGQIPVWMPYRCALNAEDIPASWDITSDTLAAWLARELGASALWIVKSCAVPLQDTERLAAIGVVDAAFPDFCARAPFGVHVLGPGDRLRLTAGLAEAASSPASAAAP